MKLYGWFSSHDCPWYINLLTFICCVAMCVFTWNHKLLTHFDMGWFGFAVWSATVNLTELLRKLAGEDELT